MKFAHMMGSVKTNGDHAMKFNFVTLFLLLVALSGSSVMAAAPVATFVDSEPGIQYLFSGDPDTLESSLHDPDDPAPSLDCARGAPRATSGGVSGKMHNDFLLCDNWDFQPKDWGKASFLQGSFVLGNSPFSNDGGWSCEGNEGPGGNNPCVNSTVRAQVTAKHGSDNISMDTSKDWVFSFDFTMSIAAGDTFGNDTLFGTGKVNDSGDIAAIHGAGADISFFVNGEPGYYNLHSGSGITPIPIQMNEGKITVHYKADNHKMDLWFNDELVVADFESASGDEPEDYAISGIQTGGGGISFENALYDNIFIGVLGDDGTACGPLGPGASAPGDFNCDGVVDVADLGIVGANFNNNDVTYIEGDANMDNVVDVADLGVVGANWSAAQSGSLSQALQSSGLTDLVPEPATAALVGFGGLLLLRRRR